MVHLGLCWEGITQHRRGTLHLIQLHGSACGVGRVEGVGVIEADRYSRIMLWHSTLGAEHSTLGAGHSTACTPAGCAGTAVAAGERFQAGGPAAWPFCI